MERVYITDRKIEDTVERLVQEGKINYLRRVVPGQPIIDKWVMRLAMARQGDLPDEFAYRPKQLSVPGSMGERQGLGEGFLSAEARQAGYPSFKDYLEEVAKREGMDIPALQPPRKMAQILPADFAGFVAP